MQLILLNSFILIYKIWKDIVAGYLCNKVENKHEKVVMG